VNSFFILSLFLLIGPQIFSARPPTNIFIKKNGGDLDDPSIFLKRIPERCQRNSFLWHFSGRILLGELVPQSLPTYLYYEEEGPAPSGFGGIY
jgi:hypothetical protein